MTIVDTYNSLRIVGVAAVLVLVILRARTAWCAEVTAWADVGKSDSGEKDY